MEKTAFIITMSYLFLMLHAPAQSSISVDEDSSISLVWHWDGKTVQCKKGAEFVVPLGQNMIKLEVPFTLSKGENGMHSFSLPQHESVQVAGLCNLKILKTQGVESATISQSIVSGKLVSILLNSQCSSRDASLEGSVDLYYKPDEMPSRAVICWKCNGFRTMSSWCDFCRAFVIKCSWIKEPPPCNCCDAIGWVPSCYQRCPKCTGRGYLGTYCKYCMGFKIWCGHMVRWSWCGTCGSKGRIPANWAVCSSCQGRGWLCTYCKSCGKEVIGCIHGTRPTTCSKCGGSGCIK